MGHSVPPHVRFLAGILGSLAETNHPMNTHSMNTHSNSRLFFVAVVSILLASTTYVLGQIDDNQRENETANKLSKPNKFLRMQRTESGEPLTLQTTISSYKLPTRRGGVQVDLVGAVHIGDKEYYQALNKKFESYDVVLYELVAPKGTKIPRGGRKGSSGNPISMLQGMTKDMLNLASQMDEVDYTRENFVHADMSPSEMQAKMAERGENAITVALDMFSEMMKQSNLRQQNASDNEGLNAFASDPLSMLFDPQRDTKMKVMMAEQFATMGTDVMGGTVNRLLIEDRNSAAMKVFHREMLKGHKKIAIFYGAAHLPDFEERLLDLGLKPAGTEWLTAWDLTKKSKKKEDPVNDLFRQLLQPPRKVYQ